MTKPDFDPFELSSPTLRSKDSIHIYGAGKILCITEDATPPPGDEQTVDDIVIGLGGHIPLWAKGTTLRWRFRTSSFEKYVDPGAAMQAIQALLEDAVSAWGSAAPVTFVYDNESWDFEVAMRSQDDCNAWGCVLASAFFPDSGRHSLDIFPKMLEQSRQERLETMIHELGHVFGLRHYFAPTHETFLGSEVFGEHTPFTIMNYGAESVLTDNDRADLDRLYAWAWSTPRPELNGKAVKLFEPYHVAVKQP